MSYINESFFFQQLNAVWMDYGYNFNSLRLPSDWDPQGHMKADGQWHAVVRLPHEVVAWEGYGVPLFEGDLERKAWIAQRLRQ